MPDTNSREMATFIVALLGLHGMGPKRVTDFLASDLRRFDGIDLLGPDFVSHLTDGRPSKAGRVVIQVLGTDGEDIWAEQVKKARRTINLAQERGIHVTHPYATSYPRRLFRNGRRPPILYCLGDMSALNTEKSVAVIGTRNPTAFGRRMGRRLAQILAEDGYAIVSGLALGCDATGHEGALDAGGRTVAILPTPIGEPVYPRENQGLADRIVESGGALVSEYAPGTALAGHQLSGNLVARDEWQPALSDGVVVIETDVDGGTRHAVGHALRTGVPVAAFDYRHSERMRDAFLTDWRFGGNLQYLTSGGDVSPIYEPETVGAFKTRMDAYRQEADKAVTDTSDAPGDGGQQRLPGLGDADLRS